MELYIGGCAQGKLDYVRALNEGATVVVDMVEISGYSAEEPLIFNRFHAWFQQALKENRQPELEMDEILAAYSHLIVISNEVGNGIVPAVEWEREYRERLGRYLCVIAGRAGRVERILCGIGQRLK